MTNDEIKTFALSCGFTERPQDNGEMDLNPYVYDFARKLIENGTERQAIAYWQGYGEGLRDGATTDWVSCSERLPENNVFVLVYLKSGYFEVLQRSEYEYPDDEPTVIWEKLCCNGYFTDWDILAWQPLPQPPSEVQP